MPPPPRATQRPFLVPRALGVGSRVALVAPAGPVDAKRLQASAERCRMEGLEPLIFPAAGGHHRYMSGTDAERLGDLQVAFNDPSVDAVWALRGGYGTLRLVGDLDLGRQREDPIPFIGFSDNTSIHALHTAMGVVSFHAPHPGGDFPLEVEEDFRRVLFTPEPAGPLRPRDGDPPPRTVRGGEAEGPLVGGNLSILASMCGTRHSLDAHGCILFLEDVTEPAYRVDRMLQQLLLSRVTEGIVGLAFGRFTESPDEAVYPTADVLADFADRLGVPCVVDLPFGHVVHNCTLPVGGRARLDGDAATLERIEAAVRSA